jgi:hypothetical protein
MLIKIAVVKSKFKAKMARCTGGSAVRSATKADAPDHDKKTAANGVDFIPY